jgi:hypothetical protein
MLLLKGWETLLWREIAHKSARPGNYQSNSESEAITLPITTPARTSLG